MRKRRNLKLIHAFIVAVSGVKKSVKGKLMPGEQPSARESTKSKKEVEEEQQKDDAADQEDDGATENIL